MDVDFTTRDQNGRDWKIAAVQRKLDASEKEIVAAEKHLEGLRIKHCGIKEELNATTAAILSLPMEILIEIFLLICQTDDPKQLFPQVPIPFIIGSVCKAWRNTAWSTPRIWSTIAIQFSSQRIQSQNQLLQEWIHRSASCPLHVYLTSEVLDTNSESENSDSDSDEDKDLQYYRPPPQTFATLFACSERWRTLDAQMTHQFIQEVASKKIQLPSLYELSLLISEFGIYDDLEAHWDLTGSQNLRKLDLTTRTLYSHHLITIDWHNLSHLKASIRVNEWLPILQKCPSLESCLLLERNRTGGIVVPNMTQTFLSLSNLHTLSITSAPSTAGIILGFITAPNLKSLSLDFEMMMEDSWVDAVIDFLQRSSCFLTDFDLLNTHVEEEKLISMLESLKTVSRLSLTISPYPVSDVLINSLNPSKRQGMLPSLEELNLEGTFGVDPFVLLEMIKARLTPQPDATQKIHKLHVMYLNPTWTQHMNPNSLQAFYHQLNTLSSDTSASLKVLWKELY